MFNRTCDLYLLNYYKGIDFNHPSHFLAVLAKKSEPGPRIFHRESRSRVLPQIAQVCVVEFYMKRSDLGRLSL